MAGQRATGHRPVQEYDVICVAVIYPAHELAHIALGHIDDEGVLIDESVKHNVQDKEETDANAFAVELLTGNAESRFHTSGSWPNAHQLAEAAVSIAKESRIDPGHIVLNYAHTMGKTFWPVANAALGF